jgi:hypothetical protein
MSKIAPPSSRYVYIDIKLCKYVSTPTNNRWFVEKKSDCTLKSQLNWFGKKLYSIDEKFALSFGLERREQRLRN